MKTKKKTDSVVDTNQEKFADVLYQKLGDKWYAFSLVDEEVFFAAVPPVDFDPTLNSVQNEGLVRGK